MFHLCFCQCFRDPEWGIRDIKDLKKLADENGIKLIQMVRLFGILSLENLSFGFSTNLTQKLARPLKLIEPRHKKTCFLHMQKNKGAY